MSRYLPVLDGRTFVTSILDANYRQAKDEVEKRESKADAVNLE